MRYCKKCSNVLTKKDATLSDSLYATLIGGVMHNMYNIHITCPSCGNVEVITPCDIRPRCEELLSKLFPTLQERMEKLRGAYEVNLPTNSNILIMLDGCRFSKYTKSLCKPFDSGFIEDMDATCKYLVNEIPTCKLVYTQSDEISLYLTDKDTEGKQGWRGNRLSKLTSLIASMATSKFMQLRIARLVKEGNTNIEDMQTVYFDSKVWVAPYDNDVRAWFVYRQNDCVRNSVAQYAQSHLSHKTLQNLKIHQVKELLNFYCGKDWEQLSNRIKYGSLIYKDPNNRVIVAESVLFTKDFSHIDKHIPKEI